MASARDQERFAQAWSLMESDHITKHAALQRAYGYQPNSKTRQAFDAFMARDQATDPDGAAPEPTPSPTVAREIRPSDVPPGKAAPVSSGTDLTRGLTDLIVETGTLMSVVSPVTGITTVNQGPATAKALNKIAAKNPLVHAALEKLVSGSGYYELVIAVWPIAVAFAYEWALPEDSMMTERAHRHLKKKVPELVSEKIIPAEYVRAENLPATGDGEPPRRSSLLDDLDVPAA